MTHPKRTLQAVKADALMREVFPPAAFVVPNVLPVGLTLLAGRPKLGKSWLCLNISTAIASGTAVLGHTAAVGDVLYLALEDGPRRLQERLKKMLGGAEASARLHLATECPALDDGGEEALRQWVKTAAKPRAVIVDVFQRIRPKPKGGGRLYEDDYSAVLPLKAIADDLSIAVIGVCHTRKAEAADPFDLISATTGLVGAADHALILDRGASGLTIYGRGRDVAEFGMAVKLDTATMRFDALGDPDALNRSDIRNAILKALAEGGQAVSPKEISLRIERDVDAVRHRLSSMVQSGEVLKVGRGQYALPHTVP